MVTRKIFRTREKGADLTKIAEALLSPSSKEPYYLGEMVIRNLRELRDNLDAFSGQEADWVASWIDYLGDADTARRIRNTPENFRNIVMARCDELEQHHSR